MDRYQIANAAFKVDGYMPSSSRFPPTVAFELAKEEARKASLANHKDLEGISFQQFQDWKRSNHNVGELHANTRTEIILSMASSVGDKPTQAQLETLWASVQKLSKRQRQLYEWTVVLIDHDTAEIFVHHAPFADDSDEAILAAAKALERDDLEVICAMPVRLMPDETIFFPGEKSTGGPCTAFLEDVIENHEAEG